MRKKNHYNDHDETLAAHERAHAGRTYINDENLYFTKYKYHFVNRLLCVN